MANLLIIIFRIKFMEAFLLTVDVLCIILLVRNTLRVIKYGNVEDLGVFRFKDSPKVTAGAQHGA